jgi:hypothetical protein
MASLIRLRRDWQSDTLLTRSEWNLLPQHRAMLPLEQALENYMFLLVVPYASDIPSTALPERELSSRHRDEPRHGVRLIGRCNWNRVHRSLRFLERAYLVSRRGFMSVPSFEKDGIDLCSLATARSRRITLRRCIIAISLTAVHRGRRRHSSARVERRDRRRFGRGSKWRYCF